MKNKSWVRRVLYKNGTQLRVGTVVGLAVLVIVSFVSLTAEIWSNNKPIIMSYKGELYFPALKFYHPKELGIYDSMTVDYKSLKLSEKDWAVWPPNPWSPYETNRLAANYPSPPSEHNLLGTDDRGRDILARLIYGFRYSLTYAALVWAITTAMGVIIGISMGYIGSTYDIVGQRVIEVLSTVPTLFLLIFLISLFEPTLTLLVLVSCIFGWIGISCYLRGEALKHRNQEYVEAARALGASPWRVVFKHVLPNSLTPVITFAPFSIIAGISGLAVLDYLGFGFSPPTPSWGELLRQGHSYFAIAWWLAVFPAVALFLSLMSLTLTGEQVRASFERH